MTTAGAAQAGVATRRRRPPWWVFVLSIAVVVVALVALLGGFSPVPTKLLPVVKLGAVQAGNEVETRVTSVRLASTAPFAHREAIASMQYLTVRATVVNTTTTPSTLGYDLIRVLLGTTISPAKAPDGVYDSRGNSIDVLQPGLAETIEYSWLVPNTVHNGSRIYVGLFERYPVSGDPVFGDEAFTQPTAAARVVTTVGAGS
jgi:hypothetical protein